MYQKLLQDASLYVFLQHIDEDLAAETRARGCLLCGAKLHSARYRRKPRGGPAGLDPGCSERFSFCCASCRKRMTPRSVRFLGRRVYLGAVVVLVSAMQQGVTPVRSGRLRALVGVDRRTLVRWRKWWREVFVATRLWRTLRGRFAARVDDASLPASLLERFAGDARSQLVQALRILSPLTTSWTPSDSSL